MGVGLTVIVTVVVEPGHPLAVGVTVYVAVPALVPAFVNVCAIVAPELALAPVTPLCTTVHANVVPLTEDDNAILLIPPLQMVCNVGLAVTLGVGFTVIVTVVVEPVQLFADGVIV